MLGFTCRGARRGPWCRGAYTGCMGRSLEQGSACRGVPGCRSAGAGGLSLRWGAHAGVQRDVSGAGLHTQSCTGRFWCWRTHARVHKGASGDQLCQFARAGVHREMRGGGLHTQGCTGRSPVPFAHAGVHREISSAPVHPWMGRSQVLGCLFRGVGINPGCSVCRGARRRRCSWCTDPAMHGACAGFRAWVFPCKIARLRSFCLEEVASISDLLCQEKRQVGISEM